MKTEATPTTETLVSNHHITLRRENLKSHRKYTVTINRVDICMKYQMSYKTQNHLSIRITLQLTVGRSVSQSVMALSPSGTHDQSLAVVKTVAVLFVVGLLP
jgi:hypothetical protein